jgi:hypothetical protein
VQLLIVVLAGTLIAACATAEKDAGRVSALPADKPIFKEYHGAQLYLLRQGDDDIVVFWGISPLGGGEHGNVRCFIQDRNDRTVMGETQPFVDPCRSAWWASDGRFLGYTRDSTEVPSSGPPLVRIPAEVRDGRVFLDDGYLQCLQNRRQDCESRQ